MKLYRLHVYMFVPLLHQLVGFAIVVNALPLEQLLPLRLSSNAIQDSRHDQHESKESSRRYFVAVQDAGKSNAQENTRRHDQGKDHGSEVFDCVKDEELYEA